MTLPVGAVALSSAVRDGTPRDPNSSASKVEPCFRWPVWPNPTSRPPPHAADPSLYPHGLTPSQLRSAYGLNDVAFGQGSSVTAPARPSPSSSPTSSRTSKTDLVAFDRKYGLPDPPTPLKIYTDPGAIARPGRQQLGDRDLARRRVVTCLGSGCQSFAGRGSTRPRRRISSGWSITRGRRRPSRSSR